MSNIRLDDVVGLIEEWGGEKGLHDDPGAQIEKFFEETGELARAHGDRMLLIHNPRFTEEEEGDIHESLVDAIGDCAVVLIQIAAAHGLAFEDCLRYAWEEISIREGETIDGVFVKKEDL